MESKGKEYTKLRFGACLMKIIDANKLLSAKNKEENVEDIKLVTSLRKLAASSTVDFSTIQKIATGKKNAAWSTTVLIAEGLNMSLGKWGDHYDAITDKDLTDYLDNLQKSKKERPSKKQSKVRKKKK
jgi:transcriptional regulator with XRE-family HTH domain